jgi:hypothetical protein
VHFAFPVENRYLGILLGESYIGIHALADFFLRLKYSTPPKKEETPLSDFMLDFEDELFTKYGNTSNYYSVWKP